MLVEINEVKIEKEVIRLTGTNLESIIMTDDLFEELNTETVTFTFHKDNEGNMKYLWKVCSSQNRCKKGTSFGQKIELLAGAVINISNNFRENDMKAKKK